MAKKKKNAKNKEQRLKFNELPKDLSTYFIKKIIGCAIGLIAIIIFFIFAIKYWQIALALTLILLLYAGSVFINYWNVVTSKIKVYWGTVEKKEQKALINQNGKSKIGLNGPCTLIVKPLLSEDDSKYVIPVGSGFACEPGNQVTIYTNPTDIYQKNDNSYYFNNPLLVSVSKI